MKLQEYIKIRIEELNALQSMWEEGNLKDPENYPMDMEEGDWYDQELAYNSSKRDN